jgi:ABC-type transporter Mla subunit MlaD
LSQLERIDSSNLGEASKIILIKAVDANLSTIIKNAQKFLEQLNDDMRLISSDINLITSSGQQFIQRHLEQFQLIGFSTNTQELLETKNE